MKNTIIKVLSVVMAMVMALGTCIVVTATATAADCKHANYEQYGDPVAATCTTWGFTVYQCSDCKDYFKTEYDALDPAHVAIEGHEWKKGTPVAPTCKADGYTPATCSVCNNVEKIDVIPKGDAHHTWGDWSTKDATCTDKKVESRTCSTCNKVETKTGNANGHKWVAQKDTVVAPKCEGVITKENPNAADGSMVYVCSVCGASKTVVIKPLEDHAWVYMNASVDTCETVGHAAGYFCKWCSTGKDSQIKDDIKHATVYFVDKDGKGLDINGNATQWVRVPNTELKEATCEEAGYWTAKCTVCGKVETNQVIPATQHEFKDNATKHVDPTCYTYGYDLYGCIHCGKIFVNKSYDRLTHKFDNYISDDPATCTTPAGKKYSCSNTWVDQDGNKVTCGETVIIADKDAKPLGHSDLKEAKKIDATCEADGREAGKTCGVCGVYVEGGAVIPKLGHNIKVTVCTATGKQYEECTRATACGYLPKTTDKTFSAGVTESHSFVKDAENSIAATCTTAGQDVLVCRFCNKTTIEVVKATGHNLKENKDKNVKPNCTNAGYYSDICVNPGCGEIFNAQVLPAVPSEHIGAIDEKLSFAATCDKDGQEVGECGICRQPYVKVLPKLGHKMKNVAEKPATCEEAGLKAYSYCERTGCELTEEAVKAATEVIKALGHDTVKVAKKAATCTEDGYEEYSYCKRSGCANTKEAAEKNRVVLTKLGHDHVKTDYAVAACGNTATIGYTHYECSRCADEYIVEYADLPAHDWDTTVMTQAVSCEKDGYEYVECKGCDAIQINEKTRVAATGHTNKAGETIVKACTRTTTDNVCVNKHCDAKGADGKDVEIKLAHDYFKSGVIEATCIMYKHEVEVCKACGKKNVNVLGTTFGECKTKETYKDEKAPTYEKAQKVVTECTVCGKVYEDYNTAGVQFKVEYANISNPDELIVNGTKKVQVTISARGDKEAIHSFISQFTFTPGDLQFVSATTATAIAGASAEINCYNQKDKDSKDTGKINITAFVKNDAENKVVNATLTGTYETLVTLTFKVKGSTTISGTGKTTSLAFTINGDIIDCEAQKLDKDMIDVSEAAVKMPIYKLADVNVDEKGKADGKINNMDYLAMQRLIEADKYDARADLNGDGKVSAADLGLLQKYLIGEREYNAIADNRQ